MIFFSLNEIMISVLLAILYGACFAGFIDLFILFRNVIVSLPGLMRDVLEYDKLFNLPSEILKKNRYNINSISLFFCFLIYVIGFIFISYASLDGMIRIYMIVISSASLFVTKNKIFDKLYVVLFGAINFILGLLCVAIRVFLYPFKKVLFFKK